jgi:signal transduction histidine kinase
MRSTVHEIRNQLAVAVANIEAFIDGKLAPTPGRLGAVLQALNKVDILMDDLGPNGLVPASLDQSGPALPASNMRPIDICALMESEAIAIEANAQAAGIAFDVDVCTHPHSESPHFVCDPVQVSQVIKNVLLNALKYTGRGGSVRLYGHREPGVMALEISDDGPGVPLAERQAIFERGMRGSAATAAGSGVGLAVVRAILDAHGGTVSVADSPSGGARFVIRLPGDTGVAGDTVSCVRPSSLLHETVTPVG